MFLTPADLGAFEDIDAVKAAAMIEDAEALAINAAPSLLGDLNWWQKSAVKAVLRIAILRWNDAGSGALTQETIGPYSAAYDTRQFRYGLTDGEIKRLKTIGGVASRKVHTFSIANRSMDGHTIVEGQW